MSTQTLTRFKFNSRYYRRKQLRRFWVTGLILLAVSPVFALALNSSMVAGYLVMVVIIYLCLLVYRPIIGYFTAILMAGSLEIFPIIDPISPFTSLIYKSLNGAAKIPLPVSAFETILLLTLGLSWLRAYRAHTPFFQRGWLARTVNVFAGFCLFGFAYGYAKGGVNLNIALFEIRSLIGAWIMYQLTCYHCKDFRHWPAISWTVITSIVILAAFTILRFIMIGGNMQNAPVTDSLNGFNHSTAIFFLVIIFGLLCSSTYGGWAGQRFVSFLLFAPIFYAMLISGRRVAFAAMIYCLGVFGIIMLVRKRRTGYIFTVLTVIILVPYTVAFWNSDSVIAEPAQAIRSQISPKERDASSDLYRLIEKANVHFNIKYTMPFGIGFGRPFISYIPMIDLEGFDELAVYTPHANFLWLWLKTGVGGFATFCLIIIMAMFQLGQIVRHGKESPQFSMAVLAGLFVVSFMVYVYVDIGFVDARFTTFFGVNLALIDIFYRSLPKKVVSPNPAKAD